MALRVPVRCWVRSCLWMLWAPRVTVIVLQRRGSLEVSVSLRSSGPQALQGRWTAQGGKTAAEGVEWMGMGAGRSFQGPSPLCLSSALSLGWWEHPVTAFCFPWNKLRNSRNNYFEPQHVPLSPPGLFDHVLLFSPFAPACSPPPKSHWSLFHSFMAEALLSHGWPAAPMGPQSWLSAPPPPAPAPSCSPSPAVSCCQYEVISHQETPTNSELIDLEICHVGVGMRPGLSASDDLPWKEAFGPYLCTCGTHIVGTRVVAAERLADGKGER